MFCNNCGKEIEQGCVFCSFCGIKITPAQNTAEEPARQPVPEETTPISEPTAKEEAVIPASTPTPIPVPETVSIPITIPIPIPEPIPTPVNVTPESAVPGSVPPPPPMPGIYNNVPPKQEKPKTFFGKGALALCLIIIGILSCSTTVFATLFFTLLGKI